MMCKTMCRVALATLAGVLIVTGGTANPIHAAQIRGEYLEARTCDVYTGPCFANAEMELGGKEAVMAWKVEEGQWNDVSLAGLGVALVLSAESTLGDDGIFGMEAGHIRSVILVDEDATAEQRDALVGFVRDTNAELAGDIRQVRTVPFELTNNHITGRGVFQAGEVAKIETRALKHGDCVCTNEIVYYQPLASVKDMSPAYSRTISFQGDGLENRWTTHEIRSAFLATFRH